MKRMLLHAGGGIDAASRTAMSDIYAGCKQVAYIAYAYVGDLDESLQRAKAAFPGVNLVGVHSSATPADVVTASDGVMVMGGNSFVLVDQLHAHGLIDPVRNLVNNGGPYVGASAGSNVAGPTVCTTNDMPILRAPRSLDGFNLVPFQINPHFLDKTSWPADYKGETREDRIAEFHVINDVTVIGIREGTWLSVEGDRLVLKGTAAAAVFTRGAHAVDHPPGSDLSALLNIQPSFNVPTYKGVSL